MQRRDKQESFKERTGVSWVQAVAVWGQLQQESIDAHAKYMAALDANFSEDEEALEHDMRMKLEDANAHWSYIWKELHSV